MGRRRGSILPSEYQQVEYIIAPANGKKTYLDLGFTFDTACRGYLGLYLIESKTVQCFGNAEQSGKYRCMISAGGTTYVYGSNGSGYIGQTISGKINELMDLEFVLKPGEIYIQNLATGDKSSVGKAQVAYTMTTNLTLFAQNYNGTIRRDGANRIHYFKYYDKNDELICDLIPCYRKADNEIGMYDIVRKIFLTNVGTDGGAFTKGPDVN